MVNEAGQTRVLSERGAPARVKSTNTRGTKYSMPAPQVGDPRPCTLVDTYRRVPAPKCGLSAHSASCTLSLSISLSSLLLCYLQVGRHARNLVLAEDQLIEAREKARKQGQSHSVDVFDQDYNNEQHFGRTGRKGHGYDINTSVGFGKRNPNDVRTRPKKR